MKFYLDVAITELFEVAQTLPPESDSYRKVTYALKGLILMMREITRVQQGKATDRFDGCLAALAAYEQVS